MNGASTALTLSGIPFNGPVGAVRVGLVAGQLVANPTKDQQAVSSLDLVIAGTEEARSEEHTSELQSRLHLVCRLLLEKKKKKKRKSAAHENNTQVNWSQEV